MWISKSKCELNNGIIIFNTGFDYGALSPTPALQSPAVFNVNGSHIEPRENLDLKCIIGVECNGIEFICNVNSENILFENENDNDCAELLHRLTASQTPRTSATMFNRITTDFELCENFILDGASGIFCVNINIFVV